MIKGYHTIEDRNNPHVIETSGPFKCTRNDAWLGHGYYFWDFRLDLAHFWGEQNFRKQGYVICEAEINDDHSIMWDIDGRTEHQEEFIQALDLMIENGIINTHSDARVSEVIQYLQKIQALTYKAIRAADEDRDTYFLRFKPEKAPKPANLRLRQRVQICLLEKSDVTLSSFRIIHPPKYST